MTEHYERTEAELLTSRIRRAVTTIRTGWDDMLPDGPPAQCYRFGTSRPAGIVGDRASKPVQDHHGRKTWVIDQADDESDIDPVTRIVSLRRHVTETLNGWCRTVMEDRPIRNPKALPFGRDVPGMCRFLDRHADWIGERAEWADDCVEELEDRAARVHGCVDPFRKERHFLGWCPFVIGDDLTVTDSNATHCRGKVTLPIGGDQDQATCDGCEERGTLRWWEEVLGLTRWETATIPGLRVILSDRLHLDVTEMTLRRWVKAGRIAPIEVFGPQPQHRRFDVRAVLDEIARWGGQCVMCGGLWEGVGDTCTRCYVARAGALPTRAEAKRTAGLLT